MKIILLGEDRIRLEPTPGALTIEAPSVETSYSPFHMVASGLATCEYSVLASWASHAGIEADDLVIEVGWSFEEKPHRVASYEMTFEWPSLPEARRVAAERATALCPIHATLKHAPEIRAEVKA